MNYINGELTSLQLFKAMRNAHRTVVLGFLKKDPKFIKIMGIENLSLNDLFISTKKQLIDNSISSEKLLSFILKLENKYNNFNLVSTLV